MHLTWGFDAVLNHKSYSEMHVVREVKIYLNWSSFIRIRRCSFIKIYFNYLCFLINYILFWQSYIVYPPEGPRPPSPEEVREMARELARKNNIHRWYVVLFLLQFRSYFWGCRAIWIACVRFIQVIDDYHQHRWDKVNKGQAQLPTYTVVL